MDWKQTLARVAPALATALGGPLAGVAVNMATNALGLDGGEDALAAAITSGDPSVLVKLKQVNQDFLLEMRRLDIKEGELAIEDRKSARDLFVKTQTPMTPFLSLLVVGGFMVMVWYVLTGEAKAETVLAGTLIGYVSAKAEQVISFYFGSSYGSKEKTKAMSDAMHKEFSK